MFGLCVARVSDVGFSALTRAFSGSLLLGGTQALEGCGRLLDGVWIAPEVRTGGLAKLGLRGGEGFFAPSCGSLAGVGHAVPFAVPRSTMSREVMSE